MLSLGRLLPRLAAVPLGVGVGGSIMANNGISLRLAACHQRLICRNLTLSQSALVPQQAPTNCSYIVPGRLNILAISQQQQQQQLQCSIMRPHRVIISVQRHFHAKGSKKYYADFRHRLSTCHYRSHLLIIRRKKMKKHQRIKWRKKYKAVLAKTRLKREIAKEKVFRVELLTMIKRAEDFDPREYALRKIKEANGVKIEISAEDRLEKLKELIRVNRYQVDYVKPKHRRAEFP